MFGGNSHCYPFGFRVSGYCNLSLFFSSFSDVAAAVVSTLCVVSCGVAHKYNASDVQRISFCVNCVREWHQLGLLGQHRFVILILHSFFVSTLTRLLSFPCIRSHVLQLIVLFCRSLLPPSSVFYTIPWAFQHLIHNKIYLFDKWPYEGDYLCVYFSRVFFSTVKRILRAICSRLPQNHVIFCFNTCKHAYHPVFRYFEGTCVRITQTFC